MGKNTKQFLKAGLNRKNISIMVVLCLFLASMPGALSVNFALNEKKADENIKLIDFTFSTPTIIEDEEYSKIIVDDLDLILRQGEPQLPSISYRLALPLGAKNINLDFSHSNIKKINLEKPLIPGPVSELLDLAEKPINKKLSEIFYKGFGQLNHNIDTDGFKEEIYNSNEPYGEFSSYDIFVGRDADGELKTFVLARIMPCVLTNPAKGQLEYINQAEIKVSYENPQTTPIKTEEYDLLIITANAYEKILDDLVDHKEDVGFSPILVTLDEIYDEDYFDLPEDLRDNQEKIKYFIYKSIFEWGVDYVLAVGGFRTFFGLDKPDYQFPIRVSHVYDTEPTYVCDQYYSCCVKEENEFDTWDTNLNDRFAEWDLHGWDVYDPYPDVFFGRLACRNKIEVKTMVEKIINYETETFGEEWFNKMISVTGDGFQDLTSLDTLVKWDISGLSDGEYTIFSQSQLMNDPDIKGNIDRVNITINRDEPSQVTFGEQDHLPGKVLPIDDSDNVFPYCYPGYPVAEIVVPDDGNNLGSTDVPRYVPPEAYEGDRWATVEFDVDEEVLDIRVKSYDPTPHALHNEGDSGWREGSKTRYEVWVENDEGSEVFHSDLIDSFCYWEGEIEGEQALIYANGGTYGGTSVDDGQFNNTRIWTSNGNWVNIWDVLNAFSEGYGLAYINGHSSCMSFGDHFPGIPGGRLHAQISGLATIHLQSGLERYQANEEEPIFPMRFLENGDKLPVLLYSGCHSGQFDTSLMSILYDPYNVLIGDRYGTWTPEGVAWWITRLKDGGSIATIGNTGYGSGYIGSNILSGLTGWLFPRFFYNYNGEDGPHLDILGQVHVQTLNDYHEKDDAITDKTVRKHWEQWVLLGDPSLKIGGYDQKNRGNDNEDILEKQENRESLDLWINNKIDYSDNQLTRGDFYKVTSNEGPDTNPSDIISSGDGEIVVGYSYETPTGDIHPGFAYSTGGSLWQEIIWANPENIGHTSLYSWNENDQQYAIGSARFDASTLGAFGINDMANPSSWDFIGNSWIIDGGVYGIGITGYLDGNSMDYAGIWADSSSATGYFGNYVNEGLDQQPPVPYGRVQIQSAVHKISGDCDETTGWHFFVMEKRTGTGGYIVSGVPKPDSDISHSQWRNPKMISTEFLNPDIAAENGYTYVVYENNGNTMVQVSDDNGQTWDAYEVADEGTNPKVLINDDEDVECFFVKNSHLYKVISTNHGITWSDKEKVSDAEIDTSISSPYQIVTEGLIYDAGDGDLYADILVETQGVLTGDIKVDDTGKKITTTIINSGTSNIDVDWEIKIEPASPLGEFGEFGPLISWMIGGHILSGRTTSDSESLLVLESKDISSKTPFGIGHALVTVTVSTDGKSLAEKSEDISVIANRIFLKYPEE